MLLRIFWQSVCWWGIAAKRIIFGGDWRTRHDNRFRGEKAIVIAKSEESKLEKVAKGRK